MFENIHAASTGKEIVALFEMLLRQVNA